MINIKADKEVKEEAQRLAKELGLSLSAVIGASIKQFIRSREIHLSAGLEPSPYLEKVLRKVDKDTRTGKNFSGPFRTAKEIRRHLDRL